MTEPTKRPPAAAIIGALSRMAEGAKERGHYAFCRLDAGWCEAAIDLIAEQHEALKITRKNLHSLPSTAGSRAAKLAADDLIAAGEEGKE